MKYLFLMSVFLVTASVSYADLVPKMSHACLGTPSQILNKLNGAPTRPLSPGFDSCARGCYPAQFCQNQSFDMDNCSACLNQCIGTYGYDLQPNDVINFLNQAC